MPPGVDAGSLTQGTRITDQRNTAGRLVIEDGKFVPLAQPAPQTLWDFPEPFGHQSVSEVPFSEAPVIARHLRAARLRSYLNNTPLRDLPDSTTPPPIAGDRRQIMSEPLALLFAALGSERTRAEQRATLGVSNIVRIEITDLTILRP